MKIWILDGNVLREEMNLGIADLVDFVEEELENVWQESSFVLGSFVLLSDHIEVDVGLEEEFVDDFDIHHRSLCRPNREIFDDVEATDFSS